MIETIKVENPQATTKDLHDKALKALVDQALITQFLEKMGIAVSEREIDQRINSIRAANGIQTQEQFRALLEKQGLNFDRFRGQLKRQMETGQFYSFIRRQATRTIEEKDLRAFYQNHNDQFKSTPEVELEECVVPIQSTEKAAEIEAAALAQNSKSFAKCLKKYAPTNGTSGMLGKFHRGMLREDVEAKVFALKENGIAVLRTKGGFQLLRVAKIKNLGPQKFESVKDTIRESLETEIVQKEYQRMLGELKASTFVKI
jgi:peptidyl-prolyl cis-trans isomerase C